MKERAANKGLDRRTLLRTLGATGALSALSGAAFTDARAQSASLEVLAAQPQTKPRHSIRFGVCGISHDHIHGMIKAVERGGGELVAAWGAEADKLATFATRYPKARIVKDQDAILDDKSLELVLSSQIANERAGIGVRAMRRGKDFLAD